MMTLLESRFSGLADYSVPPWKAIDGPHEEIVRGIDTRIARASAVVVLNTPGLHRRPMSNYEMQKSVAMDKRVIVLQPYDDFWRPIPEVLDGSVYRVSSWRSDVLGKAIRGDYPQDGRVFDIAEKAERRAVARALSIATGVTSIALLVRSASLFSVLVKGLASDGIFLDFRQAGSSVLQFGVGGALLAAGLAAILTKDGKSTLMAAAAGGLAGAAIGGHYVYNAALHGTKELRILSTSTN